MSSLESDISQQSQKQLVVPSFAYIMHYRPFVSRKQHMTRQLEFEHIKPVFVEEFDREVLTEQDKSKFYLPNFKMGEVSIFCKHVCAWRQIAQDPDNDVALVFEDDAVITFLFRQSLQLCFDQLPADFDLFMINSGCDLRIPKNQRKIEKLVYWRGTEESSWGGLGGTRCLDGYVISKKCAQQMIEMFDSQLPQSIEIPADWMINDYLRKMDAKVYWADPPLCWQGSQAGLFVTNY